MPLARGCAHQRLPFCRSAFVIDGPISCAKMNSSCRAAPSVNWPACPATEGRGISANSVRNDFDLSLPREQVCSDGNEMIAVLRAFGKRSGAIAHDLRSRKRRCGAGLLLLPSHPGETLIALRYHFVSGSDRRLRCGASSWREAKSFAMMRNSASVRSLSPVAIGDALIYQVVNELTIFCGVGFPNCETHFPPCSQTNARAFIRCGFGPG